MNPKLIKLGLFILGGIIGLILVIMLLSAVFGGGKSTTGAAPKNGISLEFWNVFDTTDQVMPLLTTFTKQTGINVNYRTFTDTTAYRSELIKALAAGTGPDVAALHYTWLPTYQDIVSAPPTDMGITPDSVRSTYVDAIAQGSLLDLPTQDSKTGKITTQQSVAGLPLYIDTLALYFNKTFFKTILAKPFPEPATTWDGVLKDTMALTVQDPTDPEGFRLMGLSSGRADNISRGIDFFLNLYLQFGGQGFLDKNNLPRCSTEQIRSGNNALNPCLLALDFFTRFSRDPNAPEYSWNARIAANSQDKELDAFVRGKVAMVPGYSFTGDQITRLIGLRNGQGTITADSVGVSPLPQVYDPASANPKQALAEYFVLSVPKATPDANKHAAWQLIQYLTSPAAQTQYYQNTGKVSARRDVLQQEQQDEPARIFANQAVYATSIWLPAEESIHTLLTTMIDSVADTGTAKLPAAVKQFDTEVKATMQK